MDIDTELIFNGSAKPAALWKEVLNAEKQKVLDKRAEQAHAAKRTTSATQGQTENLENTVKLVDLAYLTESHAVGSEHDREVVTKTAKLFTLNAEQKRAFRIVTNHAMDPSAEQLKMYLGGMGGTGKSQVIKALMHFFKETNQEHKFLVLAPTGAAAALVSGSTYHSVLGINGFGTQQNWMALNEVHERIKHVEYVFLDEISMVDCESLYNISAQMCLAMQV
ncbi:hypothetical protein FA95DRAFT_1507111, partial [Auriscalpium vulgare]